MSTPHPLDGARLKIVRAQQHLESFNEEAGRYVDTKPCEVVSKVEGDLIRVEGIVTSQPPPALACIVGDFVTNLRAALDYIAWELAIKFAGRPLTEAEGRRVFFPITPNHASFADPKGIAAHLQKVCGVPATAIDVIEGVQPYHAGYEAIGALNSLVRIDKHRTVLLCGTFVGDVGNISVYHRDKLAWRATGSSACFGMSRMKANLAALGSPADTAENYRVEVDGEPTVYISLKNFPSPGESTWVGILQQILECGANIIPRFDPLF